METIKFISPSKLHYWDKCPLRAVFSKEYKSRPIFPKHPDADLGSLIHLFIQKKKDWNLNSESSFEEKWKIEIDKIDISYLNNELQKIYYPIKWYSKYFSVKKILLKKSLLNEREYVKNIKGNKYKILKEEWKDDGQNIGGFIDYMVLSEKNVVIEIADTKTGKIFEIKDKKKEIKEEYKKQLLLYAYIIKINQNQYPDCYIKDIEGNKYQLQIDEKIINEEISKAVILKNKINKCIGDSDLISLANPSLENCYNCDYRPVCDTYKSNFINNFENKRVDVCGEILDIKGLIKLELKLKIGEKIKILKSINCNHDLTIGDIVYVYNLYSPDGSSDVLYAIKETLVKYE